jgi:hypothetical protein
MNGMLCREESYLTTPTKPPCLRTKLKVNLNIILLKPKVLTGQAVVNQVAFFAEKNRKRKGIHNFELALWKGKPAGSASHSSTLARGNKAGPVRKEGFENGLRRIYQFCAATRRNGVRWNKPSLLFL